MVKIDKFHYKSDSLEASLDNKSKTEELYLYIQKKEKRLLLLAATREPNARVVDAAKDRKSCCL
jgi:hypothetical protein